MNAACSSSARPRSVEYDPLPNPDELRQELPATAAEAAMVADGRDEIRRILTGRDPRLLAIVGPCSIHELGCAREYAHRLAALARELDDRLLLVMRVYLQKPRTSTGWKGLLLDPHLDGSGDIALGLRLARGFLREVLDLGLPTATEFIDPIGPQYLSDLVCWASIGARSTESQHHRQFASGLGLPLGFKNPTSGRIQHAVNAIKAARQPQTFLGLDLHGRPAAVRSAGNPDCHLVLRGGENGPNYRASHVASAATALREAGVPPVMLIDCSHDNSGRRPERQPKVLQNVTRQLRAGNRSVVGVMLESHLFGGSQPITDQIQYGVSVTDPCLDWDRTEACVRDLHAALAFRFAPDSALHHEAKAAVLPPVPEPAVG